MKEEEILYNSILVLLIQNLKLYLNLFMGKNYRNRSKTSDTPRKPFEKERLDNE